MKSTHFTRLVTSVFVFLFLLSSCKSTKTQDSANSSANTGIEEIAKEKLGENATIVYNKAKSYAIVSAITRDTGIDKTSSKKFFIYDVTQSKIILEDFIAQGDVEWVDVETIKVTKIPGVYNPDDPKAGYLFEVATQKKTPIKN